MPESKKQNFLKGAALLAVVAIISRVIGMIYRVPLQWLIGNETLGIFYATHQAYVFVMTVVTAGITVSLSRMVSSAKTESKTGLVKRYFVVALPFFALLGVVAMLVMYGLADQLAVLMRNELAAPGIRVLAPAVLFVSIVLVYRGYTQGFENMVPTAVSQLIEAALRAVFGLAIAYAVIQRGLVSQYISAGAHAGTVIGLGISIPFLIYYKRKVDRGLTPSLRDRAELPGRGTVLKSLLKVSAPITLGPAIMSILSLAGTTVVLGRLQNALGYNINEANDFLGQFTLGHTIFNLPPSIIIPVTISIIPAISAALSSGKRQTAGTITQSSVKISNLIAMPAAAGMMVLASPILITLYGESNQLPATMLSIMGAASFFSCLQLITTAILQANGHERIAMMTFPVGGAAQIALNFILVGNPDIGIIGSPISLLVGNIIISSLNLIFMRAKIKDLPKLGGAFVKPLLCAAVMGVAAFSVFGLLSRFGAPVFGESYWAVRFYLVVTMGISVIVYGVLTVLTRTITRADLLLVPKGEKLANFLKIR